MPFILLIVAIVAIVVLALRGGWSARRSPAVRDTAGPMGDSGVTSQADPLDDGSL